MSDFSEGTLRLTCYLPEKNEFFRDYAVLRAEGAPPSASIGTLPVVTGDMDIDLGDYDPAPLPMLPEASGLWVLEWPWTVTPHPDDITALYGAGVWRRPNAQELNTLTTSSPATLEAPDASL